MSQLLASAGQSIEVSASISVLPMNIQDWFPLGLTGLISQASLVAQRLKCLPPMPETRVQSLVQEDTLEKEMVFPTPVFLPGESHGRRSLVGYSPRGRKEPDTTHFTSVFLPGKSHGWRSLAGYSPWGHKEWDTTWQVFLKT